MLLEISVDYVTSDGVEIMKNNDWKKLVYKDLDRIQEKTNWEKMISHKASLAKVELLWFVIFLFSIYFIINILPIVTSDVINREEVEVRVVDMSMRKSNIPFFPSFNKNYYSITIRYDDVRDTIKVSSYVFDKVRIGDYLIVKKVDYRSLDGTKFSKYKINKDYVDSLR